MTEEKKITERETLNQIEKEIASSPEEKFIDETEKEIKNIDFLLKELKKYEFYKSKLIKLHDEIFLRYQRKEYTFIEYEEKISKLLGGKSKKEVIESYQTAIYNILKRIDIISANLFMLYYNDKPQRKIKSRKAFFKPEEIELKHQAEKIDEGTQLEQQEQQKQEYKPKPLKTIQEQILIPPKPEIKENQKIIKKKSKQSWFLKLLNKITEINRYKKIETKPEILKSKHKKLILKQQKHKQKQQITQETKTTKGSIKAKGFSLFDALFKKKKFDSVGETKLNKSAYYFESQEESIIPKEELEIDRSIKISPELLTEEARRIRKIMGSTNRSAIYNPSSIGYVANLTVSKISFFLLDSFPDFFKRLYLNLKLANISMLSNTYINIMVFFSLLFGIFGFIFSVVNLFLDRLPFLAVLLNGISTALISAIIVFAIIYLYPSMKISDRRRSINANLTFAIDHMSAIAGSGIVPVKMFKLLSESREYGEISIELEKIVEYMELFGYDLITALKSVSAVTPSDKLKSFFDGYISTIESGGNIEDYLKQKSDEAMTDYKVQRQSYTETISTYSDVYTGILIAAPLFFIATLSLVSMLGGQIGGIDVEKLIVFGTYIIIPFLNILFLIFLQLTQPEM